MVLAIHTLPFTPVKPTHPTNFIYFYLKQPFDINRLNKLFIFYLSHWNNWKSMRNTNIVMGTMEHHITVFGPQQHYDHHNSNDILLDKLNPAASALLSAWAPTSKGVYRLNSPEIPSCRRSADELPVVQFTNNQN